MARKVIIDCDPGIDDAIALALALFCEELEVLAVTAVEGCVPADQANVNIQGIIEELDPPKLPRVGAASAADLAPAVDTRWLHGDDGIANVGFEKASLHHPHPSEKLIADVVRANPNEVTIITLGPLTNVARAFRRDPNLAGLVNELVISGGSPSCVGNVTACAEFNVHYDPVSAREVFRSRTTKTLIPLDVSRKVSFGMESLEKFPGVESRAGRLLRKIVPFFFRAYHQRLGLESINLNDVIGLMGVIAPKLFEMAEMAGDVETSGELTKGVTVFDKRPTPEWRFNMEVATSVDVAAMRAKVLDELKRLGRMTH